MRVLFVCLGNICRSPAAYAATRAALAEAGLDGQVELDSAGLGAWHLGNPPNPRMIAAASRVGLQLDGTARQIDATELRGWDLIVAMDRSNVAHLRAMAPDDAVRKRIRLFREFDPTADSDEVPDPYYGDDQGFSDVVAICQSAAHGLAGALAQQLGSGASR